MGQLVSQDIPNLVGGVSQQSPTLRLPTQATEQINCWNSVVEGLMPRRGTERVGTCGITDQDAHIMDYRRDDSEHYRVVIRHDGQQSLRVYDAKLGHEYPVDIKDDLLEQLNIWDTGYKDVPYLTAVGDTTYREAFQLLPMKDTILVLNRTFTTERLFTKEKKAEPTVTQTRQYELSFTSIDWERYTKWHNVHVNNDFNGNNMSGYGYKINGHVIFYDPRDRADTIAPSFAKKVSELYPTLEVGVRGTSVFITAPPNFELKVEEKSGLWADYSQLFFQSTFKTLTVKSKIFEVVTEVTGRPAFEALAWVRRTDYSSNYNLKINGTVCNHKTPEATSTLAREGLRTELIAGSLSVGVNAVPGITSVVKGNVLHITSASDFTIEAFDSLGDSGLVVFKRDVRDENDLPGNNVPNGYKVKVRGDIDADTNSGYWLEFDKTDGGQGVWRESTGLDTAGLYNPKSMPLSLNRRQDPQYISETNPRGIYFELRTTDWTARMVGDEKSAPFPSFMSQYDLKTQKITSPRSITAMCVFQNRLIMASGDTLCISEVDSFFNMFPTTVATNISSDPMETTLDTNDVLDVRHITPGVGSLVLWTDRKQYVIQKDQVFAADRVSSRMVSAEAVDLSVEPLSVGGRVFFISKRGKYHALKELYVEETSETFSALDVSSHIPEYIEGTVLKMVGNTSNNAVFILTSGETDGPNSDTVYVYNYFDEGRERLQSAWSKWKFDGDVIDLSVDNTLLSFLIKREVGTDGVGGKTYETSLETIELSYDELEQYHEHRVYLDSYRHKDTPWDTSELRPGEVTKRVDDRYYRGYLIDVMYEFSPFFLRDEQMKTRADGRLQLRRLFLTYHKTSNFIVEVETLGREVRELVFQGRVLGRLDNLIGKVPVTSGRFSAPIMGQSGAIKVRIRNREIFGFTFQSAFWEGFYHTRNRKV